MDIYISQSLGLLLGLPSVILYTIECVVILREWKKTFNNSFYRLFLLSAFNNLILNFVCFIPCMRIMELGLFVDFYRTLPLWAPKIYYFDYLFTFHMENFFTVFIIFHRLSAILWPMDFERYWRRGLPIGICFAIISSLAFISPVFGFEIYFYRDLTVTLFRRLVIGYKIAPRQNYNSYEFLLYCTIGFLTICAILNILIILVYKKHQAKRGAKKENEQSFRQTLEFRLYVYSLAIFAGQILYSLYFVLLYIYSVNGDVNATYGPIVMHSNIWINDIRVLVIPSWFLFWASTDISTRVKTLLKTAFGPIGKRFGFLAQKTFWKKKETPSSQLFIVRLKERRATHTFHNNSRIRNLA